MNADLALDLARRAFPDNENLRIAYMLGLNDGYELRDEQMMKEAVKWLKETGANNLYISMFQRDMEDKK